MTNKFEKTRITVALNPEGNVTAQIIQKTAVQRGLTKRWYSEQIVLDEKELKKLITLVTKVCKQKQEND